MPIIQKYVPVETGQVKDLAPTTERRRGRPKGSKNKSFSAKKSAPVISTQGTTTVVQSASSRLVIKHLPIRHQTGLIPCIGSCKGGCAICGIIGWNRDGKGWPIARYQKMGKSSAVTAPYQSETTNQEKPAPIPSQDGTTTKRTTVSPSNRTLSLSKLFGGSSE